MDRQSIDAGNVLVMQATGPVHPDRPTSARPVVFYDGGCPLCRREIEHYKRRRGADRIEWLDIDAEPQRLGAYGLDQETAMARFHVLDADGRWQTGAWGFVALWSQLPAYRWLARSLSALKLVPLLDRGYRAFAARRLARRCNAGTCATR